MQPDLQQLPLRDIHLPEPISWWPPAPGWWGILALFILLLVSALLVVRFRKSGKLRHASKASIEQVFSEHQTHGDPQRLIDELSVLLRRISLSHYSRSEVAGLTGDAWLEFLDLGVEDTPVQSGFSAGAGAVLALAPYKPDMQIDVDALHHICLQWVSNLPAGGYK